MKSSRCRHKAIMSKRGRHSRQKSQMDRAGAGMPRAQRPQEGVRGLFSTDLTHAINSAQVSGSKYITQGTGGSQEYVSKEMMLWPIQIRN